MITRLIPHLSSIKFKLFLWFWLVTICSIATTRLVSEQLSEKMIQLPSHDTDLRFLNEFSSKIKIMEFQNWEEVIKRFNKRQARRNNKYALWIKDLDTSQIKRSTTKNNEELTKFVNTTSFTDHATWQFQSYRLTGPINVTQDQREFQLFISRPTKMPPHISMAFKRLPVWARITIPALVSFLLCWWLARTLSRPISNIAKVATEIGEGNLSSRVTEEANRKDELGGLARTFNTMTSKLEQSMTSQQRLLGDVSHELRSPLTRLQMALGLLQTAADNPSMHEKYLARCELEVSRLDEMIGNVLSLSRLENTLQHSHFEPCDITQLLRMLIEDARFYAQDKSVTISFYQECSVMVEADAQLLSSALGNIINNAVKHTPEKSVVDVSIKRNNSSISIIISDNGKGVPESALTHLFEPFYRVNEARDRSSGGTGLGLAIAKQAIELHQGTITAKNKDNCGLEVTVELPQ